MQGSICSIRAMELTVLLFGPEAKACDASEVRVRVGDQPTCAQVLEALGEAHPQLRASVGSCRLAVNHEFAAASTPIKPTDELALIGLVSGG